MGLQLLAGLCEVQQKEINNGDKNNDNHSLYYLLPLPPFSGPALAISVYFTRSQALFCFRSYFYSSDEQFV